MQKTTSWLLAIAIAVAQMAHFGLARAEIQPLVISAVQITAGTGKTAHDFIELYNPNSEAVSLEGYKLVKRTSVSQTDSLIYAWEGTGYSVPPKSFYLWANSTYADISLSPDVTSDATIANDNGIALRMGELNSGEVIDMLAWGNANNGFTNVLSQNPSTLKSLALINVSDKSFGYEIRDSAPRNSSISWHNEEPEPEPEPEDLVDGATCSQHTLPASVEIGKSISANLSMFNSGTSTWLSGNNGYQLSFSGATSPFALLSSISPSSIAQFSITTAVLNALGIQNYSWQMLNANGVAFGELCSASVAVTAAEPAPVQPNHSLVKITEIFANPVGADSGKEAVELYNGNNISINLKDWYLDDIAGGEALTSNAFRFAEDFIIPAKSYKAVTIPAGKFALNNSGGENVSLLNSSKQFVDSVFYDVTIPEGKSYALISGQWYLNSPSLGSVNIKDGSAPDSENNPPDGNEEENNEDPEQGDNQPIADLIISEIYPFPNVPSNHPEEFIEIFNREDFAVQLKNYYIKVGDKVKQLKDELIQPGSFYVVQAKDLPLQLRNTGQVVELLYVGGLVVDKVEYPKAEKGASYSIGADGLFAWSAKPTPNAINEIVTKPSVVKNNPVAKSKAAAKAVVKPATKNTVTAKPVTQAKTDNKANNGSMETAGTENNSSASQKKTVPAIVLAGLTTVAGAMFALYRKDII